MLNISELRFKYPKKYPNLLFRVLFCSSASSDGVNNPCGASCHYPGEENPIKQAPFRFLFLFRFYGCGLVRVYSGACLCLGFPVTRFRLLCRSRFFPNVPDTTIRELVRQSYDLVLASLSKKEREALGGIMEE